MPWKVKMPVMLLRLELSSLGPDGGVPRPIVRLNSPATPAPFCDGRHSDVPVGVPFALPRPLESHVDG